MSVVRTNNIPETLAAMEAALSGNGPRRIIQGSGDTKARRVPPPKQCPPGKLPTAESRAMRAEAREIRATAQYADDHSAWRREIEQADALSRAADRLEEQAERDAERAHLELCALHLDALVSVLGGRFPTRYGVSRFPMLPPSELDRLDAAQSMTALHLHLIAEGLA
jgi:hypothetical protein